MPRRGLSRFLHIERPRGGGGGDPAPASDGERGRFDAVERPKVGPSPRAATGARLERFEAAPPPEPAIELLETAAGERPFTRCMRCGTDHGLHATECTSCCASLDTPAQRAFNERLWAERQAEAAREREASRAYREAQEAASAEEARARRALAETLAREAGDAERRRLGLATGERRSVGAVLLDLVPERWRPHAVVGAGIGVAALVVGGIAARSAGAIIAGFLIGILLFVPRGRADVWPP